MTTLFLVDPPRAGLLEGAPQGLVSLASWVENRAPSVTIRLLDWSALKPDRLCDAVAALHHKEGRVLVGITATTATYQSAIAVARAFKHTSPATQVVLGGHHATPEAELILARHHEVDLIVRGEGERPLLDLALGVPWAGIPGISYRNNLGSIIANAPPIPLSTAELDSIATCFHKTRPEPGKFGRCCVMTARGCPLACKFCVVARQTVRSRSVERVIQDIGQLIDNGHSHFTIEDNFFAQSAHRTIELCESLALLQKLIPPKKFVFDCQTRVESCTQAVLKSLARAGCDAVYLGVEALTARQLRFLGKTALPEHFLIQLAEKVLPDLFSHQIEANLNLQIAIPDTTQTECDEAIDRLAAMGRLASLRHGVVRIFPHLHVAYPGTPLFQDGLVRGAYPRDIFERFTEWEATQGAVLEWMGRRFAHGAGGLPVAMLEPEALRRGEFLLQIEQVHMADRFVDRMIQLEGIEVFNYAAHRTIEETQPEGENSYDKKSGLDLHPSLSLGGAMLLQRALQPAGD
jgi:radical SAM superfamily enzyme YgiQ (UPF0313 family)